MTRTALTAVLATIALALGLLAAPKAEAGCGCSKPAPELASVRPHAAYTGGAVTLFHGAVVAGQTYAVTFTSGITGESATVETTGVVQRDLADGQQKAQVVVALPDLPLGPTSISLSPVGESDPPISVIDDDAFTVIPTPIVVPEDLGTIFQPDFQAAVTRSGVVYFSLDVTDVHLPRVFESQLQGYPLRFGHLDVVFYNAQGFLMQRLEDGMPGLFSHETVSGSGDSDVLRYSRHEFSTHFLAHDERQTHAVDPSDANWHLDGSPHIDHDHLIVAIIGTLDGGSTPVPGATPPFDLIIETSSMFQHGMVGLEWMFLDRDTSADSYSGSTGSYGAETAALSNGEIKLTRHATIYGDATASAFDISGTGGVTGTKTFASTPTEFLPVDPPAGLESLGDLDVGRGMAITLGPGSYAASSLTLTWDGRLYVDNGAGPVTIYVSGDVTVKNDAQVIVADPNPEKFAVYVAGNSPVILSGSGTFRGVLYAPESYVNIGGHGEFFGAFVGGSLKVSGSARVHYEPALRSNDAADGSGGGTEDPGSGDGGDGSTEDPAPSSGPGSKGKGKGKK